jgi:hypothetical protein
MVDLVMAYSPSTQYTEGDVAASIKGTAVMWEDTGDTLEPVSAAKPFPVGVVGAGGAATNIEAVLLASAARTTTQTSSDISNLNERGIVVILDVTIAGTGSITLTIQGKDSTSGTYYTILTGSAVTTMSTNVYRIYPGVTAVGAATVQDHLPALFRIIVTSNNPNAIEYSVGYSLLV